MPSPVSCAFPGGHSGMQAVSDVYVYLLHQEYQESINKSINQSAVLAAAECPHTHEVLQHARGVATIFICGFLLR